MVSIKNKDALEVKKRDIMHATMRVTRRNIKRKISENEVETDYNKKIFYLSHTKLHRKIQITWHHT